MDLTNIPVTDNLSQWLCHAQTFSYSSNCTNAQLESGSPTRVRDRTSPASSDLVKCHSGNKGKWKSCFSLWCCNWSWGPWPMFMKLCECSQRHWSEKDIYLQMLLQFDITQGVVICKKNKNSQCVKSKASMCSAVLLRVSVFGRVCLYFWGPSFKVAFSWNASLFVIN